MDKQTQVTKAENTEVANQNTTTPTNLIQMAIQSGADVEKLEKLMELQERWEKKESAKAFKLAMADFQRNKPKMQKSSEVDYTTKSGAKINYRFLPLAKIQALVDPVLSEFGLSYRWEQNEENKLIRITCIVSHIDGHEERTHLTAGADESGNKNAIQSIGSTVSYLKRYTLEGALGLSSDNDDDGQSSGKPNQPTQETFGKGPMMNQGQLKKTLVKAQKGEVTMDMVLGNFTITSDQMKAIQAVLPKEGKENKKNER